MKESVARKRNTVIRCHVEEGANFVTVKKRGFDICSNRIFHDFRANRLLHSILELRMKRIKFFKLLTRNLRLMIQLQFQFVDSTECNTIPGVVSKSSSKVEKTEEVRPCFSFPTGSIAAIARVAPVWADELRSLWCWYV